MFSFYGFRDILVLERTRGIFKVGVDHLTHLGVINAVNDDVHICIVRQVDLVDFFTWTFLRTHV